MTMTSATSLLQKRWDDYDEWSQLVLKQTEDVVELITEAPSTGLWQMNAARSAACSTTMRPRRWHVLMHTKQPGISPTSTLRSRSLRRCTHVFMTKQAGASSTRSWAATRARAQAAVPPQ